MLKLGKSADLYFAIGVIGIVAVLIIPLPAAMLDFLLAFNITLSVTVLLATMYVTKPLQMSVFPGMLLILTLLRLSLNVASTRLILGEAYAGEVITAFGNFVVKGNYVVGFIIFLILVIIQFVVITKGAGRISEVAARFTLDAMPGKQMAIDADLNAGLISDEEAKTRRLTIAQEADFYGAMDGASKFVRGDAVAGILIAIINVVGGLIIGVLQHGMPLAEAAQTYLLLTVGDGLVTQIPALVISVASGLLVTRAASEDNIGVDMSRQLTAYPRAIAVAAAMLVIFSFVPGMPTVPFMFLGTLAGAAAAISSRQHKRLLAAAAAPVETAKAGPPEEPPESFLRLDILEVEIGYGLIPIVDSASGGDLLDRVAIIRRQLAGEIGILVPPIRIRDNVQLAPSAYEFKLKGVTVAQGELMMSHLLAINPGTATEVIDGIPTVEPAFNLRAFWISPMHRELAELRGYTVVEPVAVLSTHLTEIIRTYAAEIIQRQDVQTLLDHHKQDAPGIIEEVLGKTVTLGPVQRILQNLLKERVPIKDMPTILETISDYWVITKDPDILSEYARRALKRNITELYKNEQGEIHVFTIGPLTERRVAESIQQTPAGLQLALAPEEQDDFLTQVGRFMEAMRLKGEQPILFVAPNLRLLIRRIIEPRYPSLIVLSYNDLTSDCPIVAEGTLELHHVD
jgi:flagellar biosynthesis protein FlhA